MDSLTYAGNPANLADLEGHPNYVFVAGDIAEPADTERVFQSFSPRGVINCAAESHVDRSLHDGKGFVRTNVLGTQTLLEFARAGECRFLQVSTDEVYGSLGPQGKFSEEMPLCPNSPYAATKASADLLVLAAFRSYGQDVVITRSSNNYGPYQYPEKLIPLMITNSLESQPLPIYGQGTNVRDWIHVTDHCEGLVAALEKGSGGRIYNLGGNSEQTNLKVVQMILGLLQQPESPIRFVQDRPGHDQRYALDFQRAQSELDWGPKIEFEQGLKDTVAWYVDNREWWESIKSGAYKQYYAKQYDSRLKDLN
jgi:dTDP-glucose 4,6-dehydratase